MANGMAKPVWVSHTAVVVPARSRSGISVIVLSRIGSVRWAPSTNSCSSGISATCSGMPAARPWR